MQLITKQVPMDFNLFLFGDDHEGSVLRHDEGWEKLVDMMLHKYDGCKNNIGVDHGDIVEAIPNSDPRYFDLAEKDKILDQIDNAVKNRERIKNLLAVIMDGNHPDKYWRYGNITKKICERLGVPYGTRSAHITYRKKNGSTMFRHYAVHGYRSITSTADDPIRQLSNMQLILKRHLKNKFADCALMSKGHTHKLIVSRPSERLYMTATNRIHQNYTDYDIAARYIHPDHRWYVNTGSFLRQFALGWSGYGEVAEYDPLELGFAIAKIRDGQIIDIERIVLETPKNQHADVDGREENQ